ncbi:hypothetical protein JCM17478_24500 [Thermopirellula anaerolimosa]
MAAKAHVGVSHGSVGARILRGVNRAKLCATIRKLLVLDRFAPYNNVENAFRGIDRGKQPMDKESGSRDPSLPVKFGDCTE